MVIAIGVLLLLGHCSRQNQGTEKHILIHLYFYIYSSIYIKIDEFNISNSDTTGFILVFTFFLFVTSFSNGEKYGSHYPQYI